MSPQPVRVRIAPSPTGDPHIGTAYMALFNYVFAKSQGGQFIIRIEDTDQTRYRKDSEAQILQCLQWLGLSWDEGPDVGGPCGPYRQSERTAIYRDHAKTLVERGFAYRCFCTPQRLDELKKIRQAQKLPPGYDRRCRDLPQADVDALLAQGTPHTIRLKMPIHGKTAFRDGLRGHVEFENDNIDDQILMKSDNFPTYHLANVVDDHLMGITHVIRGEEWISSTPKHIVLYEGFGWQPPQFYHMPLLRNADKSKISKRKNPTSVLYYQRKGILPEALRNFLALMGWNMGDNQEMFSTQEMVDHFSWDRMNLGGPVFDLQKLSWLNGQYMRQLPETTYLDTLQEQVFSKNYLARIVPLIKDRIETFEDFIPHTAFFFSGDLAYDPAQLLPKGGSPGAVATIITQLMEGLETLEQWDVSAIKTIFEAYLRDNALKPKDAYMPFRIAVTGRKDSPPLFETIEVLGKEMVRRRTRTALELLQKMEAATLP